jgi:hypothetical protein
MKYEWRSRPSAQDYQDLLRNTRAQRRGGGIALLCVGMICAFTLGSHFAGSDSVDTKFAAGDFVDVDVDAAAKDTGKTDRGALADVAPSRGDKLAVGKPKLTQRVAGIAAYLDPHAWNFAPGHFIRPADAATEATASLPDQSTTRVAALDIKQDVKPIPLPTPSPLSRIRAALSHDAAKATAKQSEPTIFERLFGKAAAPTTLAYASPDDAGLLANANAATGRYDRQTAVYDISAHMVYLPDGRALEAHSGYGPMLDDPNHADVRMRGVTPPTVYDLKEREALFHGVRALRLIPQDESKVFGRSGLLAHTFMLGPNGDSNGCVSFRDYDAFLHAYLNGEIKRLVVVSSL